MVETFFPSWLLSFLRELWADGLLVDAMKEEETATTGGVDLEEKQGPHNRLCVHPGLHQTRCGATLKVHICGVFLHLCPILCEEKHAQEFLCPTLPFCCVFDLSRPPLLSWLQCRPKFIIAIAVLACADFVFMICMHFLCFFGGGGGIRAGFQGLADNMCARGPQGADTLLSFINGYIGRMVSCIRDGGGDVLAVCGETLIAFFPQVAQIGVCTSFPIVDSLRKKHSSFPIHLLSLLCCVATHDSLA